MKKFSKHALIESFVIGSEPLEVASSLRLKADKLSQLLADYETIVHEQISNDDEDYTADITDIKNDIRGILNDIKIDNLIVSLEDCKNKFKPNHP